MSIGVRRPGPATARCSPGFGDSAVERVGVEGTGSYGAGLARFLHAERDVVEVNRNRQLRRSHGKCRPSRRPALRSRRCGRGDEHGRITAINQMRALLVSGPDDLRETLRGSTVFKVTTAAAPGRPDDRGGSHGSHARTGSASAPRAECKRSTPCWSHSLRHCSGARGSIRCGDGHRRRAPRQCIAKRPSPTWRRPDRRFFRQVPRGRPQREPRAPLIAGQRDASRGAVV